MNFDKEQMTKEVWMITIMGKRIPLEAITALIKSVAISILLVLAYSIGQFNTSEYLKWNAFFHGNCDPITKICTSCWVEAKGTTVSWNCIKTDVAVPGMLIQTGAIKINESVKNLSSVNPT